MLSDRGGLTGEVPVRRACVIAAACVLLTVPCLAQELRLKRIRFDGLHALKVRDLRSVMVTRFPSRFAWLPFVGLPPFNEDVLRQDIRTIRNLYQNEGYYNTEIGYTIDRKEPSPDVSVRVTVNEGSPTIVRDVGISFQGTVPPQIESELCCLIPLRSGDIFRIEPYQRSKTVIEDYLGNHGYPSPRVSGKAVIDQAVNRASVTFAVEEGTFSRFGEISLSGNETVDERYIYRELTFRPGDVFSSREIYRSQQNIFRTALFDSVILDQSRDVAGGVVPIEISVAEARRRSIDLGIGYGSDEGFRALGSWTRRYFLRRPSTLTTSLRYSEILWSASVDYSQSYFYDNRSSLGGRFGYDREFFAGYSNEKMSLQTRVGRRFSDDVDVFLAYNLEVNRPLSVDPGIVNALLETRPGDFYFISGLIAGFEWSNVRNALYPENGAAVTLTIEPASFLLGSSVDYLKGYGEGRVYQKVAPDVVLAFRLGAGFIESYRFTRDVPIFKRFFLGGSNTVRGYAFQGIGPASATGDPIGGNYLLFGNLEARVQLFPKFRGVVFIDGGDVYQGRFDVNPKTVSYGAGVGIRYDTVIGPVRLDVAVPFGNGLAFDPGRYRVYLSLGPVF